MKTKLIKSIQFPAKFTFKVIGLSKPNLINNIIKVVTLHYSEEYQIKVYKSSKGNYSSVNITINANHIDEIENIYENLVKIKIVRFVL
ncbi:DUF493 family protein YbeD [Candidatus Pantoea edessiphila]|uniref:UPF0250 protein CRV10_01480 n=1 Tax=Candidatus Pantoea edessiphila TaxID=2044610 RepID=A0A2P5SX55_9GAMM|nr:DUF493 family protein YbeD [Candidatus Pantoea edessiphila]PPI86904.1 hypothetical protein CRV10_01480 [Candidatus Pantoea edessiphila]